VQKRLQKPNIKDAQSVV